MIDSRQSRHSRYKGPEVETHQVCAEKGTESREGKREVGEGEVGAETGVIGEVGSTEEQII